MMTIRKAVVAGRFYSGTRAALDKELSGLVDRGCPRQDCMGAVSPHAGYVYSGTVAGKVISRIEPKESYLLLGPNHTGLGKPFAIMAEGQWQTPLGNAAIDGELASMILEDCGDIEEDAAAHQDEHSIEVQIPFLQLLNKDLRFVPICITSAPLQRLTDIGKGIAASVRRYDKSVMMIASSDMTHYEESASAKEKDAFAIKAILKLDEKKLYEEVEGRGITMCGSAPTIVMISALKALGAGAAELVDYRTSGDVSGDHRSVVGYAGIIIMR